MTDHELQILRALAGEDDDQTAAAVAVVVDRPVDAVRDDLNELARRGFVQRWPGPSTPGRGGAALLFRISFFGRAELYDIDHPPPTVDEHLAAVEDALDEDGSR